MSGTLKVGGKTLATHDTNTNVAKIQLGSTSDVVFTDSAGNNVLSESGGVVTLTADTAVIEGSSSGDLVRITQTGSGNALVVEDLANSDSTPFVVDSTGNVGIGVTPEAWTTAFPSVLQIGAGMALSTSGGDNARIFGNVYYDGSYKRITSGFAHQYEQTGGTHRWYYAATGAADSAITFSEAMRIDSSGNVLMGATIRDYTTVGTAFSPTGYAYITRSSTTPLLLNRLTDNGALIELLKDGTTVGSIGSSTSVAGIFYIAGLSGLQFRTTDILPTNSAGTYTNNTIDLGDSSVRFNDIYLGNAPNVGSDRSEKQDIEELTEAEQRVAVACKGLLRKYRWKSAVAKKGDEARIHFGIIAQDLQAAFEAEGLDAGRYGMFMSNTWWETSETYTDDEGVEQTRTNTYDTAEEAPEGAVERTRLGVRYSELLAFIIAAI